MGPGTLVWAGELRKGEGERALKASVLVTQPGAGGAREVPVTAVREWGPEEHQEGTRKELGCHGVPGALGKKRWTPKDGENHP